MDEKYKTALRKFFQHFPEISLGNVKLRDLSVRDAEDYLAVFKDERVNCFLSDEDLATDVESAQREIRFWGGLFYNRNGIYWAIADSKTDKLIGAIGFSGWNFYNRRAEVSYELLPAYWRQGIMSKALSAILNLGFQQMQINRVEARTMVHNIPSQGLLKKFGFKEEGIIRDYRFVRGEFIDVMVLSLLKEDFIISPLIENN